MSSTSRVLAVSGAIGCATAVFLAPSWQDVIEPAQVLAGLVEYPPGNPVALYSTRTWTILQQVPALLLGLGVSERTIALMLSGLTGMVSFQALGIATLAVGGDTALACVLPFFIYVVQATAGGVGYPVYLLGWPYTSGSIGLSWLLLSVSLLGAGAFGAGLLLLGLLPSVHVTLGAWGLIIAALAVFTPGLKDPAYVSESDLRRRLLAARWWLVAGLLATAASAVVHQALVGRLGGIADVAGIATGEAARYLVAVMTFWDNHRRPFTRLSIGAAPFFISVSIAIVWLRSYRDDLPAEARYLLRALLVAAALGVGLSVLLAIDPAVFRFWLWRAMPSRLMNLPLLACMPVVAGLAVRTGNQVILAVMMGVLALVLAIDTSVVGFASSYAMLAATLALAYARSRQRQPRAPALQPLVVAVSLVLMLIGAWRAVQGFDARLDALADRTSSSFFAAVAGRPGVLVTASDLHLVQLRTRRPVLLDGGALDALAYIPEAAPETARILQRVYGIDLFAPGIPPSEGQGALPRDAGRDLWQTRTVDDWRAIGREFDVTDVLAFEDWTLRLPVIARGEGLALYAIPRP